MSFATGDTKPPNITQITWLRFVILYFGLGSCKVFDSLKLIRKKKDEEIHHSAFYPSKKKKKKKKEFSQLPLCCSYIRSEETPCQTCTPKGLKVSGVPSSSCLLPLMLCARWDQSVKTKNTRLWDSFCPEAESLTETFLPFPPSPTRPHNHLHTLTHTPPGHVLTTLVVTHTSP